ncbi:YraN family protein [Flavobacteriaceae bacterium F08102]|nr:YraN family protein [Flavobacteriaceae bacterium F08102]
MAEHNVLGERGETLAYEYLLKNGYTVLERNYRYLKAEVDLIAIKGGILAVVEVKTRSNRNFGLPQDFVSKKKIKLMVMAIDHYIQERELDVDVRFDIIAIVIDKNTVSLAHLEDAFYYF